MTGHVLAAVDLNAEQESTPVLRRAAQIAALDGATLSVITVIPDYGSGWVASFFPNGTLEKAIEEASTRLHALVDGVLPGHGVVQHIVAEGRIDQEVLRHAQGIEATLIVIGTHEPGIEDYLAGTNAAHIVRDAKASVLVVR